MSLTRHYAKLCNLPDFEDPELAGTMDEVAPDWGSEKRHRKGWEFAMGALFLRDVGRLTEASEILDVGAGSEEILYWMANRAGRVVATDIYGRGSFAGREAVGSMIDDPKAHAPYPYREDRLEVLDMDARELAFPDESFDAVVSFSSIEHFGGYRDIQAAAREIGRVLRPDGHAFIVTEAYVDHHILDRAPVQFAIRLLTLGRRCYTATPRHRHTGEVFTVAELGRDVVDASGLQLMQPFAFELAPEAGDNIHTVHDNGVVVSTTGEPSPHVMVRVHRSTFTSICLPLVKRPPEHHH